MSAQPTCPVTRCDLEDPAASLRLELTPAALDDHCGRLARHNRTPALLLHALTTLQSFISQHAGAAYHGPQAVALRACLERHLDAARQTVLEQQAQQLRDAWCARDSAVLAACYIQLSRNGFRQAVRLGLERSRAAERELLTAWVASELERIELRARGEYPDTFDYTAAGIDPAVHCALTDLAQQLGSGG